MFPIDEPNKIAYHNIGIGLVDLTRVHRSRGSSPLFLCEAKHEAYDNGQVELNKILASVFSALLRDVEFRKVYPSAYRLFQVADLICTLELISLKMENHILSKSEMQFFGNQRDFQKNYLKPIRRLRFADTF